MKNTKEFFLRTFLTLIIAIPIAHIFDILVKIAYPIDKPLGTLILDIISGFCLFTLAFLLVPIIFKYKIFDNENR